MTKRQPSNTAQSLLKAAQAVALGDIQPPPHMRLSPDGVEFWSAIVRARAREEWREVDLVVACQLAECQADVRREQEYLRVEGTIIPNDRGTLVENPRCRALATFANREMALIRTLQLGGTQVPGNHRTQLQGARRNEEQARRTADELKDELLA